MLKVRPLGLIALLTLVLGAQIVTAERSGALSQTVGQVDAWSWDVWTGRLNVRGWALTSDFPTVPLGVRVTIDGYSVTSDYSLANRYRPDVGQAYPGYGDSHGFDFDVPVGLYGSRYVCVQAQNSGVYNQINGCMNIDTTAGRQAPNNVNTFGFTWQRSRHIDNVLRAGYYQDSSVTFSAASGINQAMARWDAPIYGNNKIDTFVTGYAPSKVVFYQIPSMGSTGGYLQYVHFTNCAAFNADAPTVALSSFTFEGCFADWVIIKVTDLLAAQTLNTRSEVIMHELGHALGLGHVPQSSLFDSLMKPTCCEQGDGGHITSRDQGNIDAIFALL